MIDATSDRPHLHAVPSGKKPARRSARPAPKRDPRLTAAAERRQAARRARAAGYAFAAGIMLGGIIPTISWAVAHFQTEAHPYLWAGVAGGLCYSAPIVAAWFSRYVGPIKGWGFVVSLEVAMTFTEGWTSIAALAVLVALNAYVLGGILRTRAAAVSPAPTGA